jgi:dTDP-4-amino-4,6-dideoxygalactose transaminase
VIKFNIPYRSATQIDVVKQVIESNKLAGGGEFSSKVRALLKDNYNFEHTYLTTSCTAAIQLCAMAVEFKPNDEIVIPSYTFASTPSPFLISGAKIVFADCDTEYPNLSIENIKAVVTKNTKAVMVVHYGGFHEEMEQIQAFCKNKNIILIEDAAQSIHSFNRDTPLGSYGDFSVFSFHETKNINCGEGGLLVVNNEKYLSVIDKMYECGTNRTDFFNGKVKNYEWVSLGLSFTLSELNAGFLYSQLCEIDQITEHRKNLWNTYYDELHKMTDFFRVPKQEVGDSNCHTFFILLNNSEDLQQMQLYMRHNDVHCYSHYYPLHESVYAKEIGLTNIELKNTSKFGNSLLRLPLHNQLSQTDAKKVSNLIKEYFENN